MNARPRLARGRLAAFAAAGIGVPLALAIGVIILTGRAADGACSARPVASGATDVGLVASGPDPLAWRLYEVPVEEEPLRHNHLHGGVAVQYGDAVRAAAVRRIADWYDDDPVGILVAPRPELGDVVRATAWSSTLSCDTFDEDAFAEFRDAHRFRGPERVPPEELRPEFGVGVQVTPQPVRRRATISFALLDDDRVEVDIRDRAGRTVRRLGSFVGSAGQLLRLRWDARDALGRRVPAGRYEVVVRPVRRASFSAGFTVR